MAEASATEGARGSACPHAAVTGNALQNATPSRATAAVVDLRGRLGWFLLVRLLLVSLFFFGAAALYVRGPYDHSLGARLDPHLGLIALGYGVTAVSGLLLPWVRRIFLYAAVQIGLDLGLVSLVIVLTGGLESPLPVLYNLVILNAALLRLGRGIATTAVAATVAYSGVLAVVAATAPGTFDVGAHAFTHATNILSFFAIAALATYLTRQLVTTETLLVAHREELGRVEAVQRLVANAVDNGLVVTDCGGRITSANLTAAEILGREPSAVTGLPLDTVFPGAADLPADGPPAELTIGEHPQTRRVLRVKAATVTDTYHNPIGRVYVLQDVTTMRDMENRLREAERIEECANTVRPLLEPPVATFEGLVGQSQAMLKVFAVIEKVAPTDSTILITGESGTGKELVARALHARSARAGREFVAVNCGAIPETLIESELFGHVRGAFTGAIAERRGLFRQAHGGTIFLDEIGELPLTMQVRLLRVLQDRQITPVGGSAAVTADVRVVAATNRDLERLVAEGRFREDLYYRLNVIRIATPSLRGRPEDIPLLLLHLLRSCSARHAKVVEKVSPRTMRTLMAYSYPGNIRELENIVDHAVTLCEADTLTERDLPARLTALPESLPSARPDHASRPEETDPPPLFGSSPDFGDSPHFADGLGSGDGPGSGDSQSLDDRLATYEKDMLLAALERAGGVRKRAAELLGIKYRSLRHRLSKYGLATGDDDCDLEHGSKR